MLEFNQRNYPMLVQFRWQPSLQCPLMESFCIEKRISLDIFVRKITEYATDIKTNTTDIISHVITDEALSELLDFFSLDEIREWLQNPPKDCETGHYLGYREWSWVKWNMYLPDSTEAEGKLTWVYADNPFEKVFVWMKKWFPDLKYVDELTGGIVCPDGLCSSQE